MATSEKDFRAPSLRLIRLGSETVTRNDVQLARKYFGERVAFLNWLRSEEAGMAYFFVDHKTELLGDIVPVGHPIDGTQITLIDADGQPIGAGEIGEIVVTSRHLFPGYWRNPNLTDAVITTDPKDPSRRSFRTGDVGRFRDDGLLEHLGRKDFQIKIRGYSVEPAEVEAAILSHQGVKQAAVIGGSNGASQYLIGYVVPRDEAQNFTADLKHFLSHYVPDYMVPSRFEFVETLPTTANGKIDRRALAVPPAPVRASVAAHRHPASAAETVLKSIWQDVLEIEDIGVDDDFFDLGGESLIAMSLVARIEQEFGASIPLETLWFEGSTIRRQADIIGGRTEKTIGAPMETTSSDSGKRKLG